MEITYSAPVKGYLEHSRTFMGWVVENARGQISYPSSTRYGYAALRIAGTLSNYYQDLASIFGENLLLAQINERMCNLIEDLNTILEESDSDRLADLEEQGMKIVGLERELWDDVRLKETITFKTGMPEARSGGTDFKIFQGHANDN